MEVGVTSLSLLVPHCSLTKDVDLLLIKDQSGGYD